MLSRDLVESGRGLVEGKLLMISVSLIIPQTAPQGSVFFLKRPDSDQGRGGGSDRRESALHNPTLILNNPAPEQP